MKNDYARYTSECRTLSLQATDMEGQHAIMTAAEKVTDVGGCEG